MRPFPYARTAIVPLLLFALAATSHGLGKGDSAVQVRDEMGRPLGELKRGDLTILLYKEHEVFLREGLVVAVKARPSAQNPAAKAAVVKVVPEEEALPDEPELETGEAPSAPEPLPPALEQEEPWPPPGISSRTRRKMLRAGKTPVSNPELGAKMDLGKKMDLR